MITRRTFMSKLALASTGILIVPPMELFARKKGDPWDVPVELQREMYKSAIAIAKKKIRTGDVSRVFKIPFLDAAFNGNIFLWDTCFIACYAKYHQHELPIANALDNFYNMQEEDGYICREYLPDGKPMWPKEHPVSINPPLLAFAELELYSQSKNKQRLSMAYPHLKKFFYYLVEHYRMDDQLFFNDAFGSGMDNIPRYPFGWKDDGKGIPIKNLHPEIFVYEGLSPLWNRQGLSTKLCRSLFMKKYMK